MQRFKYFLLVLLTLFCGIVFTVNVVLLKNPALKSNKFLKLCPLIQLGVDLRGGTSMTLSLDKDLYMNEKYHSLIESIKEVLWKDKIQYSNIISKSDGIHITSRDVKEHDTILRNAIRSIDFDLLVDEEKDDLFVVKYNNNALNKMSSEVSERTVSVLKNRIDGLGTKEMIIQKTSGNDILIQIPSGTDVDKVRNIIKRTARMGFYLLAKRYPVSTTSNVNLSNDEILLPEYVDHNNHKNDENYKKTYYRLIKIPLLNGDAVTDARAVFDNIKPVVSFRLNKRGTKDFALITTSYKGRHLAIVFDDKVISIPKITETIRNGNGVISGHFTMEDARELALLLSAGSLPTKIDIMEENEIGASLGYDSIIVSSQLMFIGIVAVMLFMFNHYKALGIVASLGLLMNLIMMVAIFAIFGITLTLPGIAGIILTLGMAIDANVLIYERMKEENDDKRDARSVVESGFRGALRSIVDSNVTTILSASTLLAFGNTFIKGFATTLSIGIFCSMFSTIAITRSIINLSPQTFVKIKKAEK